MQNRLRKDNRQYSGNTFFNPSGTICHGNNVPYFYGADVHGQSVRLVPLGSNRKTCSCQRRREERINFLLLLLNQRCLYKHQSPHRTPYKRRNKVHEGFTRWLLSWCTETLQQNLTSCK